MRIGIDARFYGSAAKGLGRYTSELLHHLETLEDDNDYVVFLRAANIDSYVPKNARFTKALADFPWYGWQEQVKFPSLLRSHNLDLMHFPHFNVPMLYRRPFVTTVHDLILLRFPTTRATTLGPLVFWIKFQLYKLVISHAIRGSRRVMAVSEGTRKDILLHYPDVAPEKIVTTLLACSPALQGQPPALRGDITQPFTMYVGNAYPHKNLEKLLDGFAEFRKRGHENWRLVLVGAMDYFYTRLQREAGETGRGTNVTFFGHATDAELHALYAHARFYTFPSLYEGFGLPPLESMHNGLPVAASNASCMPEICGDAARYFDPTNADSMADAMHDLATNDAMRAELIAKGHANTKRFDWKHCAEQTLAVYRGALSPTR